jgi:hypothetical protein
LEAPRDGFTIHLGFFIPFSLPSRARTGNAVPDYLPGIKEADSGGVAVVLLLFQLQQSSTSPLPFSRHLRYLFFLLAALNKNQGRRGCIDGSASALSFCVLMLQDREVSILQLVARVVCVSFHVQMETFTGQKGQRDAMVF